MIELPLCCFWSIDLLASFFFFFNRIMEDEKEMLTSGFKSDVSNFASLLLPRGGVKMFLVNESIIKALATPQLLY